MVLRCFYFVSDTLNTASFVICCVRDVAIPMCAWFQLMGTVITVRTCQCQRTPCIIAHPDRHAAKPLLLCRITGHQPSVTARL